MEPKFRDVIKNLTLQLMSHSQTIQELMKANLDLRTALHLAQTDKELLNAHVDSLLVTNEPQADADSVSV